MIALEVSVNGNKSVLAGRSDLSVLSAEVTASGKLGKDTYREQDSEGEIDIWISATGLSGHKDESENEHLNWIDFDKLKIGDEIKIKVIETDGVADAIGTDSAYCSEEEKFQAIKNEYFRLREKFEK